MNVLFISTNQKSDWLNKLELINLRILIEISNLELHLFKVGFKGDEWIQKNAPFR